MNILFGGYWQWNAGSSHVIANYVKAAQEFNCEVRIASQLGYLDQTVSNLLPTCSDLNWGDHIVLVFETDQYLSQDQISLLRDIYSKNQITIIDPDGRYGPTVIMGDDTNHDSLKQSDWANTYEYLSDCILQPKLANLPNNTHPFSYFGMENINLSSDEVLSLHQTYSIQYIGSNWYRWQEVDGFLEKIRPIRNTLGRIAFKGMWWDGNVESDYEKYTKADVTLLKELDIEVSGSVPFEMVIPSMGDSIFSPIFVRPMISAQKLITPRMFETICANTIPLVNKSHSYVRDLFGSDFDPFIYDADLKSRIPTILSNIKYYKSITDHIKKDLFSKFNYSMVFKKLLSYIDRS